MNGTKGITGERVLGKEEVSEKYSMLQQHGSHSRKIQSWSNMQLNDLTVLITAACVAFHLKKQLQDQLLYFHYRAISLAVQRWRTQVKKLCLFVHGMHGREAGPWLPRERSEKYLLKNIYLIYPLKLAST